MGITGWHASFHQFSLFVVKCLIYFRRPWQFPYACPYTVILLLILTALVIWAAIIVGTSLAVRYVCARVNLFRGVFSKCTVFFIVGTWMGYRPMTLHVVPPGEVLATMWTLNHFWCVLSSVQTPSKLKVPLEGLYMSHSACYSEESECYFK